MNPSDLTGMDGGPDAPSADGSASGADRYLVAHAAGHRLAVPLGVAREILTVRNVTRLPGAPSCIAGLVNVRGSVLTVLDVGVRLGAGSTAGPVIVVEHEARRFGLRMERVDGVARAEAAVAAVDEARSAEGAICGLVTASGAPALLVDVAALQRTAIAAA